MSNVVYAAVRLNSCRSLQSRVLRTSKPRKTTLEIEMLTRVCVGLLELLTIPKHGFRNSIY